MAFGNTWNQWNQLSLQDADGTTPADRRGGPQQGPQLPAPPQPGPQQPGQQWPFRAQRAPRYGRPITAPSGGMKADHFAQQAKMIQDTNSAIGDEMASRRKLASQQRSMAFQAQENQKNRQHEMQMAQLRPAGGMQQEGGLTHQKLDVLEGLLGTRQKRVGNSGPMSVDERKYSLLKRAF